MESEEAQRGRELRENADRSFGSQSVRRYLSQWAPNPTIKCFGCEANLILKVPLSEVRDGDGNDGWQLLILLLNSANR